MKKYKRLWIRENTHKIIKVRSANEGISIADMIDGLVGTDEFDNLVERFRSGKRRKR